jgi:hypothetical protein
MYTLQHSRSCLHYTVIVKGTQCATCFYCIWDLVNIPLPCNRTSFQNVSDKCTIFRAHFYLEFGTLSNGRSTNINTAQNKTLCLDFAVSTWSVCLLINLSCRFRFVWFVGGLHNFILKALEHKYYHSTIWVHVWHTIRKTITWTKLVSFVSFQAPTLSQQINRQFASLEMSTIITSCIFSICSTFSQLYSPVLPTTSLYHCLHKHEHKATFLTKQTAESLVSGKR